jgi:hypothetical protein
MNPFTYVKVIEYFSSLPYFNYIIILTILIFILAIILTIISYFAFKFFKLNINDYNILFYQYSKKSKKILDLYGDYKLTKIHIIKQPISRFSTFIINLITLYNYDKILKKDATIFPYHISLLFEIKLPNNMTKFLLFEKNNSINVCENFLINNSFDIKTIHLKKTNYSINSILTKTLQRIGNKKFFNWHIYNNNCQESIKEILITINKYKKYKKFIIKSSKRFFNTIIPTEFTLHIYNSLVSIMNIIEKYIIESSIFN